MIRREFVTLQANNGRTIRVPRDVATLLLTQLPDIFEKVDGGIEDKAMRPTEDKCRT